MSPIDVDALPPTQYAVLDVLAARYRTGEQLWAFPTMLRPALRALEQAGLIFVWHGIVPKTLRAGLTDAGRAAVLLADYTTPIAAKALAAVEAAMRTVSNEMAVSSTAEHARGVALAIPEVVAHVRDALRGTP